MQTVVEDFPQSLRHERGQRFLVVAVIENSPAIYGWVQGSAIFQSR